MKWLYKEVEEFRAGRAPLREAVSGLPLLTTHLSEPKPLVKASVEGLEAPDNVLRDASVLQRVEDGPPWDGGKALLCVERNQPEGLAEALLENDKV